MSSQKDFNIKYERFFLRIGFVAVWILLLGIVSDLMRWDNKTFGIVLILCGLTGFYHNFSEGVILKKEKENEKKK